MAAVILDTNVLLDMLKEHEVSIYRLAKAAENRGVSQALVYALTSGRNQPSLESLGVLIDSLQEVTGQKVEVGSLLKYVSDPVSEIRQAPGRLNRISKKKE